MCLQGALAAAPVPPASAGGARAAAALSTRAALPAAAAALLATPQPPRRPSHLQQQQQQQQQHSPRGFSTAAAEEEGDLEGPGRPGLEGDGSLPKFGSASEATAYVSQRLYSGLTAQELGAVVRQMVELHFDQVGTADCEAAFFLSGFSAGGCDESWSCISTR